jgi:hypothetical protein
MRWLVIGMLALSLGCGASGTGTGGSAGGGGTAGVGGTAGTGGSSGAGGTAGTGGSGGGFQGCGDVGSQCVPTMPCDTAMCSFDPAEVDCTTACAKVIAVCDGACGEPFCVSVITEELCLMACETEKTFSCGNATFGCYTVNDSCDSIAMCLGCSDS